MTRKRIRACQPTVDRTPSLNLGELALHLAECTATAHQPRMTPASPSPSGPRRGPGARPRSRAREDVKLTMGPWVIFRMT